MFPDEQICRFFNRATVERGQTSRVFESTYVAAAYLIAWLRRWVAPEAGRGGLLLIVQPAVIFWSNAVMLNVPSLAMELGALYDTRRWIDVLFDRDARNIKGERWETDFA
jgi:hypothetical protein